MSDDKTDETSEAAASEDAESESAPEQDAQSGTQSGPKFTKGPDPLGTVKKGTSDVLASMEGKTVSMKLYVGTIIGVVVLMMLARCGG